MGKKPTSSENGALHKLLQKKIEELEVGQQRTDEEIRADEAHKAATTEVKALVNATDVSLDSKVKSLQTKLLQRVNEVRTLEYELGRERRRSLKVDREYDALKSDLGKMTAAKNRLEALSRELSKQNRALLEESEARMLEEKLKREEIVDKFDEAMAEMSRKLEMQSENRPRQDEEVESLKAKLKDLTAKYDIREEHFALQLRTKELEVELGDAKTREHIQRVTEANEHLKVVKAQLDAQKKTEATLRAQLAEYGNKFENFQETLDQNNQVFSAYTTEIEKMSKTVKQLQKTNAALREENGNLAKKRDAATHQLVSLKAELEDVIKSERHERDKREKLEKLCRGLTAERVSLQQQTAALQKAWQALKKDIDLLRSQDDDNDVSDRLWELLERLMLEEELEDVMSEKASKSTNSVR